ncbi:MAG: DUF3343 domain-containing protein [Deltaproteobacteria bacterium]|nr:DUF3343 domain-containing protein [Deltaproteobacteria bacterium]
MNDYIATFGSTHKALKAEKVLKEKNVPFKLIPAPKKLAAFCDLAITFEEQNRKTIENAFIDSSIKAAAIYKKQGEGYVKM